MRYSIITPTICRESLLRLFLSIDGQTQSDWEHLVVIDTPHHSLTRDQRKIIESTLIPPRANRSFSYCERKHNNYGHTCRHQAWERAKGDYILYLDDDDYLAHHEALSVLDSVVEAWAVFPVLRHGQLFFNLPPGTARTGTGMFIHKREIGKWPDSNAYEADGLFVEGLLQKYRYQALDCPPLVIQPKSSFGISNAESWYGDKAAKVIGRWELYRHRLKNRIAGSRTK
ncbi:MAG: hypothetical protein JWQ87_1318 [Candidatus Sulfotelmatobacter sp.]|nr:hypothetical protein [Candidatus Sulfotelmatobacter sp.]